MEKRGARSRDCGSKLEVMLVREREDGCYQIQQRSELRGIYSERINPSYSSERLANYVDCVMTEPQWIGTSILDKY